MIYAVTHGRAGIIGNPTDGYGGSNISCSIENQAKVTIEDCNDLIIENQFGRQVLRWENDYENKGDYFDIIRSVLRYFKLYNLKARITTASNIPVQAGLAGSTAILSASLSAISTFVGEKFNKYRLAEINRTIELNYLKCQCGYQDAYMTTFGGLNFLDFRGKEYYKELDMEQYAVVENISEYVDDLQPFVIAHTGIKHNSGNFHKPLREKWLEGDKKIVNGYKEIVNITREGKKALINKNWDDFAYLMNKNHKIQDSLCDSGEQNRNMIKVAMNNGGMAAKLAGAGGGGTIIVLTFEKKRVMDALKNAGIEQFIRLAPKASGVTLTFQNDKDIYG